MSKMTSFVAGMKVTDHPGIVCDACGTRQIWGTRWKCLHCDDYDECNACHSQHKHHPKHVFAEIRNCNQYPLTPFHPPLGPPPFIPTDRSKFRG
jgi:hypothetical protein